MSELSRRRPRVLFVGAFPPADHRVFGGMVTSCKALLASSLPDQLELMLLDSTQVSNPPPPFFTRLRLAAARLLRFVRRFEAAKPEALILFVSAGASVVEKGVMAWYGRFRGVPALMFPRAGAVVDAGRASSGVRRWIKLWLRGGHYLVCQSDAWRAFAVDDLGFDHSRVHVLRNWTAAPDLLAIGVGRENSNQGPVRLVFVGWVEHKKGVMELLAGCRELADSHRFKCHIVGDGHAMQAARDYVEEHGLSSRVHFDGWLERDALLERLADSDVFVLPSWAEGLPNALVEAMAAGLAPVVSRVGAIGDIIVDGENGLLVEARSVEGLRDALAQVIDNSALRARLASEAHRTATRQFGVEAAAARIVELVDLATAPAKQRESHS